MNGWSQRSREEARLFNPSFLSLVIWLVADGFREVTDDGMPFQLTFVAVPVVLHKQTRESLPRSTRTSLATWIEDNASFRVGFADRARALAPLVREGLLFGSTHGFLAVSSDASVEPSPRPRTLTRYLHNSTDEVRDCAKKAEFVGKWLAGIGAAATVMTLWGVKP